MAEGVAVVAMMGAGSRVRTMTEGCASNSRNLFYVDCTHVNCTLSRVQPNPFGLLIIVVCGIWAYWEWRKPGGKLAPKPSYARR